MIASLEIAPDELRIVKEILGRCLPPGTRVFAFGSRATGVRLKPWSDLDLAVQTIAPLDPGTLAALADEFDEAPIDWKVDVLDLATVNADFRRIIEPDLQELI